MTFTFIILFTTSLAMDLSFISWTWRSEIDNKASVEFFKVDVEGSEPRIIKGAQKLLKARNIESFVMEMKLHTFDEDTRMMITLFFESGFELYKSYINTEPGCCPEEKYDKTLQM